MILIYGLCCNKTCACYIITTFGWQLNMHHFNIQSNRYSLAGFNITQPALPKTFFWRETCIFNAPLRAKVLSDTHNIDIKFKSTLYADTTQLSSSGSYQDRNHIWGHSWLWPKVHMELDMQNQGNNHSWRYCPYIHLKSDKHISNSAVENS